MLALRLSDADEYSSVQLMDAYNQAAVEGRYSTEDIRLAYKLARDPFYRKVLKKHHSFLQIEKAGFFDDELPPGLLDKLFDPRLQTTSLNKIKSALSTLATGEEHNNKNVVLLTTGAFAPIHEGHLDIMESARAQLSAKGFRVIGGFIAPAHDYYVKSKGQKADLWNSERRLAALKSILKGNNWIEVDPWMLHHTPTDLMFTDVILRMDAYLKWNLPSLGKIEVIYVFGGDHTEHSRAFLEHGMAICISNRKGYEADFLRIKDEFSTAVDHRMFFAQTAVTERSSRDIRLGKQPIMDELKNASENHSTTGFSLTLDQLSNYYQLNKTQDIRGDKRGSINQTWFVGDNFVLTVFKNRTYTQVDILAKIAEGNQSGLLPVPIKANIGDVSIIQGKPAILWHYIHGIHYVGEDHSQKIAIPETAHAYIARSFWKIHDSLRNYSELILDLGIMNYQAVMQDAQARIANTQLPDYLSKEFVDAYLKAPELPLRYLGLVHTDMERHNLLHNQYGEVVGVVDVDAIMGGDILFEYAHILMNFVFTDPAYTDTSANIYIEELINAGMIEVEDIYLLPAMIKLFAAEDLLYYYQYDDGAKTDLPHLTEIYQTGIERSDNYFTNLTLSNNVKPTRFQMKTKHTHPLP